MAAGHRAQVVDHVHTAGDGGGEADAVVGAEDIVVHGLGDGDHLHAFAMEALGVAERVVAANGDQIVQAQGFDFLEHGLGGIDLPFGADLEATLQMLGQFLGLHLTRVCATAVQEGAALAAHRSHGGQIKVVQPFVAGFGNVGLDIEQAGPSAAQAQHFHAFALSAFDHHANGGIQAGNVAPAG